MYFLNRTPSLSGFIKRICPKHMHWTQKNIHIEHLKHRCILRIHGPDANSYLQGILTNNMNVNEPMKNEQFCIYSLILNPHGRVLYDCLVYKTSEQDDYLLEHDAAALQFIKIHLDMYRLRRQVRIQHVQDAAVWVAYRCEKCASDKHNSSVEMFPSSDAVKKDLMVSAADPRVNELGHRFVVSASNSSFQSLIQDNHEVPVSYDLLRYKLGIGEGVADHPPGGCLPLEINADFLNGISFDKGCYVGQELTARTYHTGVVRKRIMPVTLLLESDSSPSFPAECAVLNNKKQKMGKLRNHIGKHGLAVLNVEESMKGDLVLEGSGVHLSASKPQWWPMLKNVTT